MPPKQTRATRAAASKSADSETPALTAETAPPASASASASAPAPAPTPAPPAAKPTTTETPLFLPNSAVSSDDDEPTSPIVRKKAPAPPRLTHIQSDSSGSSGDDEDDDYESDDDPVVREYDVFMTSELAQHLHLFQYPVRSRAKPYTSAASSCPVDARFKPKAGLVEVDVPVNIAVNFDKEKGKVWGDVLRKSQQAKESGLAGKAMGAGRTGKRRKVKDEDSDEEEEQDIMFVDFEEAVKKGRVLSKQTLGSKIQADEAKYMVGVFRNGCSPLRCALLSLT